MKLSESQQYRYQPLGNSDNAVPEIRVIDNVQRGPSGIISLTLEVESLSDASRNFDAVSYAWGSPEIMHPIQIQGRYLKVRDNIWRFLNHYVTHADKLGHRALWIDSICIDQRRGSEKNAQVRIMDRIFAQANCVLVWLGMGSERDDIVCHGAQFNISFECGTVPYSEDDNTAFKAARKAGSVPYPEVAHIDWHRHMLPGTDFKRCDTKCLEFRDHLNEIFFNPYWTRLWIVQELVLARQVWVVVGQVLVPLKTLIVAFNDYAILAESELGPSNDYTQRLWPKALTEYVPSHRKLLKTKELLYDRISEMQRTQQKVPLAELISNLSNQLCEEPKDKIYALLGIILPNQPPLLVNYSNPNEHLFYIALYAASESRPCDSQNSRNFDLEVAMHLSEALQVTSSSFSEFYNGLHPNRKFWLDDMGSKLFVHVHQSYFWVPFDSSDTVHCNEACRILNLDGVDQWVVEERWQQMCQPRRAFYQSVATEPGQSFESAHRFHGAQPESTWPNGHRNVLVTLSLARCIDLLIHLQEGKDAKVHGIIVNKHNLDTAPELNVHDVISLPKEIVASLEAYLHSVPQQVESIKLGNTNSTSLPCSYRDALHLIALEIEAQKLWEAIRFAWI